MITADSHQSAVDLLTDTLTVGLPGVPVYPPPTPPTPVAGPGVLVAMPELVDGIRLNHGMAEYRCQLLVLAGDTSGGGLLDLLDRVSAALSDRGIRHSSSRSSYQPPNFPAPLPAQLLTLE